MSWDPSAERLRIPAPRAGRVGQQPNSGCSLPLAVTYVSCNGGVDALSGTKILVCFFTPENYAQVPEPVPDPCLSQEGGPRAKLPLGARQAHLYS